MAIVKKVKKAVKNVLKKTNKKTKKSIKTNNKSENKNNNKSTSSNQNVNINVDLGHIKYVDSSVIAFNKSEFIIDFKKVSPRFNMLNVGGKVINNTVLHVEHSPIAISPKNAKKLLEQLIMEVKKYEKTFGEINSKIKIKEESTNYIG